MTKATVAHTHLTNSTDAGLELGRNARETLGLSPDLVIAFISPVYEQAKVLQAIKESCQPKLLVGSSSSGEFTNQALGEGLACTIAFRSDDIHFSVALGHGLSTDLPGAVQQIVSQFQGPAHPDYPYRAGLTFLDWLAVSSERFMAQLSQQADPSYEFFGGGAADNMIFHNTPVFHDTQVLNDTALVLEILARKPLGIGVGHNWVPTGERLRVTEVQGAVLISIDGQPAIEALHKHARNSNQVFDLENPMPFLLNNFFGIETDGGPKLRAVMQINPDGSLVCGADIPAGSTITMMRTTLASTVQGVEAISQHALERLNGHKPAAVLFFDCPTARYRLGEQFANELEAIQHVIADVPYVGCNTYGEIALTQEAYYGALNSTPVICVIPE